MTKPIHHRPVKTHRLVEFAQPRRTRSSVEQSPRRIGPRESTFIAPLAEPKATVLPFTLLPSLFTLHPSPFTLHSSLFCSTPPNTIKRGTIPEANRPSRVHVYGSFGGAKGNCPTFHSSLFTLHSSAQPRRTRSRLKRPLRRIANVSREASSHEPTNQPVAHQGATSPAPSTLGKEGRRRGAGKPFTTNAGLSGRASGHHNRLWRARLPTGLRWHPPASTWLDLLVTQYLRPG